MLTPAALFVVGTLVNINSGPGPPVAPVSAQATTPEDVAEVAVADEVEHGRDTRYSGGGEAVEAEPAQEVPGREPEPPEVEEEKKSWIRVRIVDEEGNPVPSERYRITCPDGTVKERTTDANGMGYVSSIDPGMCQIEWPDLDRTAVRRGTGGGGAGGGGGGTG